MVSHIPDFTSKLDRQSFQPPDNNNIFKLPHYLTTTFDFTEFTLFRSSLLWWLTLLQKVSFVKQATTLEGLFWWLFVDQLHTKTSCFYDVFSGVLTALDRLTTLLGGLLIDGKTKLYSTIAKYSNLVLSLSFFESLRHWLNAKNAVKVLINNHPWVEWF